MLFTYFLLHFLGFYFFMATIVLTLDGKRCSQYASDAESQSEPAYTINDHQGLATQCDAYQYSARTLSDNGTGPLALSLYSKRLEGILMISLDKSLIETNGATGETQIQYQTS